MSRRLPISYEPGGPSNSKKYPFFVDRQLNAVIPPWFVECQRDEAEKMLARKYPGQNVVLMRPSRTSGQYALTVQTYSSNEGAVYSNYCILHGRDGFRMDVDNAHSSKKTLSEIIELFVKLAGVQKYQMYGLSLPTSPTLATPNYFRQFSSPPLLMAERLPPQSPPPPPPAGARPNRSSFNIRMEANEVYKSACCEPKSSGSRNGQSLNGDYLITNFDDTKTEDAANSDYLTTNFLSDTKTEDAANSDYLTTNFLSDLQGAQ